MSLKCFEVQYDLPQQPVWNRVNGFKHWLGQFEHNEGGIDKFAEGYKLFGMNRNEDDTGFVCREYLPCAKQAFLIGEFNNWENTTPMRSEGYGRWAVNLPDKASGEYMIPHKTKYKLRLESNDGNWHDRVPAWAKLAWQDGDRLFDAAMWEPPLEERYVFKHPHPPKYTGLKVYESHVGMSSPECKINTYLDFADYVLPRIKKLGYNCIQLMAVAEHAYYGCFGYHVTSFFAPSSRFGTPEELKYLIDRAHSMGIAVLMDLVHAHCSSNAADGIAHLDGTDHCYTHGGLRGYHQQWDSRLFNYESYETMRFLLSNVKYWVEEFRFDGFRFDGVSSMLYFSHAIGKTSHDYYGPDADVAGHIYLMLANDVIKRTLPTAITIAEDVSGMPTLALPIEWGGFGFDARLAMAIPDMWIKILKESPCDEAWSMKWIAGELQNRRPHERSLAYAESHDQAIVGDKTVAFWLMDAEMYTNMSLLGDSMVPTQCIERGIALHKMIRMVCLALGEGYLNFCGNEFGHPEWVDFPREGNGWSYHHANRRYDLPDMDHLRYKYLNCFDIFMHAVENRFKFLSDWHYHCTMVSEEDKIIVVERGECMIIMNFHPVNSYSDYRVGSKWNEPMRCIMDSDEGRFGGHMRLQWGHANSFPVGDGWMSRNHSIKIYIPARTVQVLVPEKHLQGGVRIYIDNAFLRNRGIASIEELEGVLLEESMSGAGEKLTKEIGKFTFDSKGVAHLPESYEVVFMLKLPDGTEVGCASEFDGHYHIYFPGMYVVSGIGVVDSLAPWEIEELEKKLNGGMLPAAETGSVPAATRSSPHASSMHRTPVQAAPARVEVPRPAPVAPSGPPPAEVHRASAYTAPAPAPAPAPAAPEVDTRAQVEAQKAQAREEARRRQEAAEAAAAAAMAAQADEERRATEAEERARIEAAAREAFAAEEQERMAKGQAHLEAVAEREAAEEDSMEVEMTRNPSMHFFGMISTDEVPQLPSTPFVRTSSFEELLSQIGGDVAGALQCYKDYGLHKSGDSWFFREWVPDAAGVFLVGEFNKWDVNATPLMSDPADKDIWYGKIKGEQALNLKKGSKYKVYVTREQGKPSYVTPAWCTAMVHTKELNVMDAVVWPIESPPAAAPKAPPLPDGERIYECHLGFAAKKDAPRSFKEASEVLIPRVVKNGYTSLMLLGVQESRNYADMGAQPCSYFAPCSALGTPEDLQKFVQDAHAAGLRVYMNVAHDGAARCIDGLGEHYFKPGTAALDPVTGAGSLDYANPEVVKFLVGNLGYWMAEFGIDGFRFPRVSWMIYTHRGRWLPEDPAGLDEYLKKPGVLDEDAVKYLKVATEAVEVQARKLGKVGTTIAKEHSGYPGLCKERPKGLGFSYRQFDKAGNVFRSLLQRRDEDWGMAELLNSLAFPRVSREGEPVLACVEPAEECVVSRRPLKIAMLAWETLHTIAVGGVAPHVTEMSAALHGAGHEVHIFTRAQGGAMDNTILGVHYHEVCFDSCGCMVQNIRNMCGAFVCALNGHESVWGPFDVVHGHDWLAGPAICQLKGQNKRCVFTMHSTEGGRNGDMGKGHPGIKDIERGACGTTDQLICVSSVLAQEVCGCCSVNNDKISVIYNGIQAGPIVNMEWHDDWTGNTKRDMGWSPMDPMFLFVGRHTAQKGCDVLIEAIPFILQARGDAKFAIVGDGHLKAMNESRVHQMGIGHAVCFTGSLKSGSAHLQALFKACDAVVVPSRNEPFGIVVLEAWCAGKPVVATTSGGPRDFVKPDEDGYLVDPNPGSVAWGCCKILENFQHSQWMGKNAQAKAIREFSWENFALQTEQVYYKLLGLEGAPRGGDRMSGHSLANKMLVERCFSMTVSDQDPVVMRGMALLKLMKLLVASVGGDGLITWMGTEFGQIDSTDLPRQANGYNQECSRVKFELADDSGLKFAQLQDFESTLNHMAGDLKWLTQPKYVVLVQSEEDKVIACARAGCIFVCNFHPHQEHRQYNIQVPPAAADVSRLKVVLNTNDAKFGGQAATPPVVQVKRGSVAIDLAPRSAVVLAAM